MKARIALGAILGLLVASTAFAIGANTYTPALKDTIAGNYARRVAIVYDGTRAEAQNANNINGAYSNWNKSVGNLVDMLREQGAEVHFYDTRMFDQAGGLYLWQRFGDYYPLAIGMMFTGDGTAATRRRYWSAESTTTTLMHIGGANGSVSGGSGGFAWTDSSYGRAVRGYTEGGTNLMANAFFTYRKGCVVPYGSSDTLFFDKGGYDLRSMTLFSGVSRVVRLFKPVALTSNSFAGGLDSALAVMPTGDDSVAAAGEYMPVAYRVEWDTTGRGASGVLWGRDLTGPARSVYYVKTPSTPTYTQNVGHIALALASRFVQLDPIKIALEFDDVTDSNPSTGPRATNAAWDSIMVRLRDQYALSPTLDVDPDHAVSSILGTTPDYANGNSEVAWSGEPWSWMRKWKYPWIHHSHDSCNADRSSNLVGRFGGYGTANSSTDSAGAFGVRYKFGARYASRYEPGNANQALRYGIVQRLQYSDSLRRQYCPECPLPPYLSFPDNQMLPVNWRPRSLSANPSWKVYAGGAAVGSGYEMTVDSLLWAIHVGLGLQSGDRMFMRTTLVTGTGSAGAANTGILAGRPWGNRSVFSIGRDADGDSLPSFSPFTRPDERWRLTINGRVVDVTNMTTLAFDGGSAEAYRAITSPTIATLMGTRNPLQTVASTVTPWSVTYSGDRNGLGQPNEMGQVNAGSSGRTRMVYSHPLTFTNATGPNGSYYIDVLEAGLLRPMRAMNYIAGHTLVKWVYPWEVYDK